jgi:hypothetical protein
MGHVPPCSPLFRALEIHGIVAIGIANGGVIGAPWKSVDVMGYGLLAFERGGVLRIVQLVSGVTQRYLLSTTTGT